MAVDSETTFRSPQREVLPAAPAAFDRLGQISALEKSVVEAKVALGAAEVSMRSVHAGLALEPMAETPALPLDNPMAIGDAVQDEVGEDVLLHVFDRERSFGRLMWSQVPVMAQVVGLVLVGWCIAMGGVATFGQERVSQWAAVARSAVLFSGGFGGLAKSSLPGVASIAGEAEAPGSEASAVVIYERTSPYPSFFATIAEKDRRCLAEAIYYEARGEPVAGQIAVAQVVLNRTLAGSWPRKVCEVTLQGVERGEKCQFSYACQRSILSEPFGNAWDNAVALAEEVLDGGAWLEEMLDATHFHRSDLRPVWRLSLEEVGRYGRHIFYNSPTENRRPLSRLHH